MSAVMPYIAAFAVGLMAGGIIDADKKTGEPPTSVFIGFGLIAIVLCMVVGRILL